ncbi:AsmA family protein [Undibacterium sp. TS12]|uniref:AsmA family protein n=1 Tax=Undibacterium sp. TS12 TaxID=2908202 RepID=UPI001F4C761F|nr:AsmA family protein [Undibacterium sp. TS12]MCH8619376.1 AsmA family protein [Undibacterium sp. TS12]
MKRLKRTVLLVVLSLSAITGAALLVLDNLDWNRIKPWLNASVSEALDRPFSIQGDLSMIWEKPSAEAAIGLAGWRNQIPWPHLRAQDIRIGQPEELKLSVAKEKSVALPEEMASIRQLDFSLNPFALLSKKIIVPQFSVEAPVIHLRRTADQKNNWTIPAKKKPASWQLELHQLVLSKGKIHLVDAVRQADVEVDIDTINETDKAEAQNYGISWKLQGKLKDEALTADGKAGSILSLQQQATPFPILATVRMGHTLLKVEGTLTKPSELAALDMHLSASGVSMARLYTLTGIVFPETPAFSTEGHLKASLSQHSSRWIYEKFSGKVGSSDIAGNLDFQSRLPRPHLTADVSSQVLNSADLAPLIGADSNASKIKRDAPAVQPANKLLPVETFKVARWNAMDADVSFNAASLVREKKLPIRNLKLKLHLQDGTLSLSPLDFEMAGGQMSSSIIMDGSGKVQKNTLAANMKLKARHIELKQLFPTLVNQQMRVGELNGDATLSASGNSVASLLGGADGEIRARVNHGTISKLLLEEMGLNIGSVILARLTGDKQVKLNCMVSDFNVSKGLMQTREFWIDTEDAILQIEGKINLSQESMDLTIKPESKGIRVLSLRAPIYIRGNFQHPVVNIDKTVLGLKAGAAIALAVTAPIAALLPLVNAGQTDDGDCLRPASSPSKPRR